MLEDKANPAYQVAVKDADRMAERVKELARSPAGIPSSGAVTLLRNDPLTQGPKLFAKNCASCHRYQGHDGTGHVPRDPQAASDLAGFGSRAWLTGLLDPARISTTNYFGGDKIRGRQDGEVREEGSGQLHAGAEGATQEGDHGRFRRGQTEIAGRRTTSAMRRRLRKGGHCSRTR